MLATVLRLAFAAPLSLVLVGGARAQCGQWSDGFATDGVDKSVFTLAARDFGQGPVLLLGGDFTVAGDRAAAQIASWDGATWSNLGGGLSGTVPCCPLDRNLLCSVEFDDGSGPAVYIGGRFLSVGGVAAAHVAKWDGANWSAVGAGFDEAVQALAVFDDGSGPALYAGGAFRESGGVPMNSLARWNGTAWQALGAGFALNPQTDVRALVAFDDGSGPALYFGGQIFDYNGVAVGHLGRWDGATVTRPGAGFDLPVNALIAHDDGTGVALFSGGKFTNNGATSVRRIAKWDGAAWNPLVFGGTNGLNGTVEALATFDDGAGDALFIGGAFGAASGVAASAIVKWDGGSWTALGAGLTVPGAQGVVESLAVFDDGSGPALYAGGSFTFAGASPAKNVARWSAGAWSALGGGAGAPHGSAVSALAVANFGAGSQLYAGGSFNAMGTTPAQRIARFDGAVWHEVGGGVSGGISPSVEALLTVDDGTGPVLYVGGSFTSAGSTPARNVAKWDGASWTALGAGLNGPASVFELFDDGSGPALFVGGGFSEAGGQPASAIAKWDGSSWSGLGSGVLYRVTALRSFDDGTGPALFVAGDFTIAGGAPADGLARWDGTTWTAFTHPTILAASDLAIHDDGGGPALFALAGLGSFPNNSLSLAKWSGSGWDLVGGPLTQSPAAPSASLFVHNDGLGAGDELFVGGDFEFADGTPARGLAAWNGASWRALGGGIDSVSSPGAVTVSTMVSVAAGGGARDLYVGGRFTHAGGQHSSGLAVWNGCVPALGDGYCFGDGSATDCPCGNGSASGAEQGCAHSGGFGAQLVARGSPSIADNSQVFTVELLPPNKPCVLFMGNSPLNGGAGVVFGDGLRCAGPSVRRLGVRSGDVNGSASWGPGLSSLGYWSAGDTRYFQVWFRDSGGPCGSATNMSSALAVTFTN